LKASFWRIAGSLLTEQPWPRVWVRRVVTVPAGERPDPDLAEQVGGDLSAGPASQEAVHRHLVPPDHLDEPWFPGPRKGNPQRMADTSEAPHETEAELRLSRVRALNSKDLMAVVTYLLARHPDSFPPMLDDALSSVSPKNQD
jgi:hypothetical protein